ncbi:MAG: ABC transporter substrate binding protein [Evtepia sp.]
MKKNLALIALLLSTFMLTACSTQNAATSKPTQKLYKIAIVQPTDLPLWSDICDALNLELTALELEKNIQLERKIFYVQDTDIEKIGKQIVREQYDAMIPLSTTVAQYMIDAAEQKIPVVFATDHLTDTFQTLDAVSGVSGVSNTNLIFDMMFAQKPDIQTVGLLYHSDYSTDEIHSAKTYLDAKGITYVEQTAETERDLIKAATLLSNQVDVVFTPSTPCSTENQQRIAGIFKEKHIPYYTSSPSFVQNGAFASCSADYTEIGKLTADLTISVLETAAFPPYHILNDRVITVNADTAEQISANYAVFYDIGQCRVLDLPPTHN